MSRCVGAVLGKVLVAGCLLLASLAGAQQADGAKAEEEARARAKLELQKLVTSWASAWQSQFDDVYLMHYHPSFKPEGFKSIEDWQAQRRSRVKDSDAIAISLSKFELVSLQADRAVVRFWLDYSRPGYADHTHKEMGLRLQGQIWMIDSERNLEVVKSPASETPPAAQAVATSVTPKPATSSAVSPVTPPLPATPVVAPETVSMIGSDATRQQVIEALRGWVAAWQAQRAEAYFSHYHADFMPEGFKSLDDWKAQRRARLRDAQAATLAIDTPEFVAAGGGNVVVRFWLSYRRPGYADRTRKELVLTREGDDWLISREHNIEVTRK